MKTRLIAIMMMVCLLVGVLPGLGTAATTSNAIYINGTKVAYQQAPITKNGTTLVSAKETITALGLQFNWDQANKRVIATNGNVALAITLGEPIGFANGVSIFLGTPAVEVNGKVMVPLRFLTEGLGASAETKNGTVLIKTANKDKSKYYTNLPLQITNPTVKNVGYNAVNVNYVEFVSDNDYYYTLDRSVALAAGQKAAFEHASSKVLDDVVVDGVTYTYMGRAVKSITMGGKETPSKSYEAAKKLYYSADYDNKMTSYYNQLVDKYYQDLKKQLVANKNIPLRIESSSVTYDSIGTPEANIEVQNLTDKRIVSFEVSFSCYDSFNQPVNRLFSNTNRFTGVVPTTSLDSGNYNTYTWKLYSYDLTTRLVNITIEKVAYSDGTVWKRK